MNAEPFPAVDTLYAPAGRAVQADLQREVEACLHHPLIRLVLEMANGYVVVLNQHRQVLTANQELLEAMQLEDAGALQGLRIGEVMGCVQVPKGPDGCGTARNCSRCGAVLAILACQALEESISGECHLDRYVSGHWKPCDFRIRATPLKMDTQPFTVVFLQDISAEKQLRQMEALFLHDLLNLVQGLHGWSERLQDPQGDQAKAVERIQTLASVLNEEVLQQQMLLHAEGGLLAVRKEQLSVASVFEQMERTISQLPCSSERRLDFEKDEVVLFTDGSVLQRVLGNMIINALESTPPEGEVKVQFRMVQGSPCFRVHNPGVIPEVVRPRIFQRGFSTKGHGGHGLGAYMMKFLGENVLEGEVSFESSAEEGTCFQLLLPRDAAAHC